MALDLYKVIHGFSIAEDDESSSAHILQGDGAPVGNTGRTLNAPIGSIYLQTDADVDSLNVWFKHVNNGNANDWVRTASKDYVDAIASGISWREPVLVHDDTAYSDVTAAETAANVGDTVDGVVISAGDRILLSNFTGSPATNENVYIVSGSSGSWTFTEDTNLATDGDAVFVQSGTYADQQWLFDGSAWIQFGSSGSGTDITNLENYTGKPVASGAVFPQYASNDIVVDNDSLTLAISKLDDALGTLSYSTNNVVTNFSDAHSTSTFDVTSAISELDATYGDGNITTTTTNYSLTADLIWGTGGTLTLTAAFDALNNSIGDKTYTNQFLIINGESVATSLNAIDTELGDLDNSGAWTANGYLSVATLISNDIQENLDSFNQLLGSLNASSLETTGGPLPTSTVTTVDSVATAGVTEVKWMLQIKNTATGGRKAWEIHALTDGTLTDFNRASALSLGSGVGMNPTIDVTISGGNMILTINPGSTSTITYTVKRIATSFLA